MTSNSNSSRIICNPSFKGGEIPCGRPSVILGETLRRYLSGLTPRTELPPGHSCNTAAPFPCLPEIRRAGVRRGSRWDSRHPSLKGSNDFGATADCSKISRGPLGSDVIIEASGRPGRAVFKTKGRSMLRPYGTDQNKLFKEKGICEEELPKKSSPPRAS